MFKSFTARDTTATTRRRFAKSQLSVEALDRRQLLSGSPWSVAAAGISNPTPSPSAVGTTAAYVDALPASRSTGVAARPPLDLITGFVYFSRFKPEVKITVGTDGQVTAAAKITMPSAGPQPILWGTPIRSGSDVTIAVRPITSCWPTPGAQVITTHTHEYQLGTFSNGTYRLKFTCDNVTFVVKEFTVGKGDRVRIQPVEPLTPVPFGRLPVTMEPLVVPLKPQPTCFFPSTMKPVSTLPATITTAMPTTTNVSVSTTGPR